MKQALQYVIDNLRLNQSGEIDIVNVCIILISFRARNLIRFQTFRPASDTSRSLPRLLSAILFLHAISEQLVARL